MLLNRAERAVINNPLRNFLQRNYEARRLLKLGGGMSGGTALEVGCGSGAGVEVILDVFGAERVHAFDLDPQMVARAERHLARRRGSVELWVGDVCRIPAPAESYDAVFDFGIIHHVPNWRDAIAEIRRVLRPGGVFYAEEVLDRFILNPVMKRLFLHPFEDRFDAGTFSSYLETSDFQMLGSQALGTWFAWFAARKRPATLIA